MNLRDYERESIRRFVQSAADDGYLSGRVIDYGCGKQPYRDIVEAASAEYIPFDRADFPGNVGGDTHPFPGRTKPEGRTAILCTQVIQYVPNEYVGEGDETQAHYESGPSSFLRDLHDLLYWSAAKWRTQEQGHLVLTYPTNWPEVEPEDLHRFTKAGMERLLTEAGFTIVRHEMRASFFDPWIDRAPGKRQGVRGEEFAIGYGVVARA